MQLCLEGNQGLQLLSVNDLESLFQLILRRLEVHVRRWNDET